VNTVLLTALVAVFVIDAAVLVLAVLLQSGRGGGLAGALGGLGGGESALGTRATSTIAKITWVLGGVFLFTCVFIAWLTSSAQHRGAPPVPSPPAASGGAAPAATAPPSAPEPPAEN